MSSSPFARERTATSLQNLEIVRKIVEREGCVEALTQLLTTHARAHSLSADERNAAAGRAATATATLAAAPMVLQSLLEQLRGVSVLIVESVEQWRRSHPDHRVFQWRSLNYLAKMLGDLTFLSLHSATLTRLHAFSGLRLERNPFLSLLHLDHLALKQESPDAACRLALFVGNVDMKRIFAASKVLLQEEQALGPSPPEMAAECCEGVASPSATMRLHWSHRSMKLAASASAPDLATPLDASDPREAVAFDVELAKELVFQHEHELGAMKEELAVLQRRLQRDLLLAPDQRRQLQTRAAGLLHDIQLRAGDLFHRRNELQRKQAALRLDKRRVNRSRQYAQELQLHQQPMTAVPVLDDGDGHGDDASACEALSPRHVSHLSASAAFQAALQADELRRQDLVDKFDAYSKLQASVSRTKRKLQSLSPQAVPWRSATRPGSVGAALCVVAMELPPLETMTVDEVSAFVRSLPVGDDAPRYASLLRAKGIDGALLAQADECDLEQLGVELRLHRLKILDAVQQTTGQ